MLSFKLSHFSSETVEHRLVLVPCSDVLLVSVVRDRNSRVFVFQPVGWTGEVILN